MTRARPSATSNRIACLGGIYSNYLALDAALADIARRGADAIYCLGDLGAFGPHPDRVFPLLHDHQVHCIQGNYDDSVGNALDNCQCGYTDSRDNYFAQLSYDYTLQHTSAANRQVLRDLPAQRIVRLGQARVLLCHGSPRRVNEFLWQSTTSTHFLKSLCRQFEADVIVATHTGIKWQRPLGDAQYFVNAGVIGRPENDGQKNVWYTMIEAAGSEVHVQFVPVQYDYRRLADEMRREKLPDEFIETIVTGWWTTCLEVLPAKERSRGRF